MRTIAGVVLGGGDRRDQELDEGHRTARSASQADGYRLG